VPLSLHISNLHGTPDFLTLSSAYPGGLDERFASAPARLRHRTMRCSFDEFAATRGRSAAEGGDEGAVTPAANDATRDGRR
jgi:hypothetical protein